ncbi:S41 family peptidase [Algivirga pacifica]|uniref:Tail specific protease domain-containing protein n=1 Tax=Algivirga pacifica TaxID=1162670 RepID=A0ABP9DRJ9_9BACT
MKTLFSTLLIFTSLTLLAKDPVNDRQLFLDKVFKTLEENVANPIWLEGEDYQTFKAKMYAEETLSLEEGDFYKAFNKGCNNLSFTHFYLISKNSSAAENSEAIKEEPKLLSWKPLGESIAYLDVRSFAGGAQQMMTALQEIGTDTYKNLIIDLRYNGGGSLDAPVILGQFLTNKPIDAGVYLTRKWFTKNNASATVEDIGTFPYLTDFTYQGIMKMFAEEAAFRMVVPGHERPVFKGKVFVLVNQYTASACEPLIYLLKKEKIATLVGSASAGAMLSANAFTINEDYDVFVPVSDYQTYDGIRLDKVGVQPNIAIEADKALELVLEQLQQ